MKKRLVSLNLNHRTHAKVIHPELLISIRALEPDLLVLCEYVEGNGRPEVCETLAECMTRDLAATREQPDDGQVVEARRAGPAHAFGPVLKLKEQELKDARADLEKSREVAQGLREKVDELSMIGLPSAFTVTLPSMVSWDWATLG